ncbi:hypothetical protein [Luedemannella helvata]|uniref:Uncharacterized protein n=1 Tax=Luedemannella helvata TaxID=349315 RepID=A0ABN2L2M5_9ACTN
MSFPRYVGAFALTLLVEAPLYVAALVGWFGLSWRRAAALALAANALTHPALWWSLRPWADDPAYLWVLAGAEAAVCVIEWAVLAAGVIAARGRGATTRLDLVLLAAVAVGVNGGSVLAGVVAGRMD